MAQVRPPLAAGERSLGLQWVVAVVAGWAIGFFLCEALEDFLSTFFVDGLVIGSAMGIAQGLVLRKHITPMLPWVVISIIGFGIGKFVADAVGPALPGVGAVLLSGAIIGLAVGLVQSVILRQRFSIGPWWIVANVLAWAAGWSLISVADGPDVSIAVAYGVGALGAALVGVITGIALIGVSRHPIAQPLPPEVAAG
jgi:hypothetical protein